MDSITYPGTSIEVQVAEGPGGQTDFWLGIIDMARLFEKDYTVIGRHVSNAYRDGELDKDTYREYDVITEKNGRKWKKSKKDYNLDVILSVGYRINGRRGTEFRKWATELLTKHIRNEDGSSLAKRMELAATEASSRAGHIYLIESQGLYKIGRAQNMENRFRKYVTENPNEIRLIHSYQTADCISEEKRLHSKFEKKRYRGEWFSLEEKDIAYISSISRKRT